jgi:hypothetical protein
MAWTAFTKSCSINGRMSSAFIAIKAVGVNSCSYRGSSKESKVKNRSTWKQQWERCSQWIDTHA